MLRRKFLLSLFNLLYTHLAWMYDLAGWLVSGGLWYRWARQVLPFVEEGPVLEVGFGRGKLLQALAEKGHRAVGVDWSMQMARHATAQSGQPVVQGDGRCLPFPDAQFRTLLTTFPAPYIVEPVTQREFARVVEPGGLWLWVDAPAFYPMLATLPVRLVTWIAWGSAAGGAESLTEPLLQDRSGGLWQVEVRRVPVGPSTVALRIARRMPA